MKDAWQIEAEAANKTIDRMGRQNRLMRRAIQQILDDPKAAFDKAWDVRAKLREIDEELWKEKGPVA